MRKIKKTIQCSTRTNPLPFYISVGKNEYFFAKLQWLLFKKFGIKRSIPCGRTEKDRYLCCCLPLEKEYVYLNKDKTKAYCKCCGSLRIMSNRPIDLNNLWGNY
jgi:hypothetical protein